MSLELARECVIRGSHLLDVRIPGWVELIDWEQLSLVSVRDDILGQLFGNQWEGRRALGVELLKQDELCQLGFMTYLGTHSQPAKTTASELETAWKELANSRHAPCRQ
jgi:hypothetical protein